MSILVPESRESWLWGQPIHWPLGCSFPRAVVLNLFCAMDPFESLVKPTGRFSEKCI
jgi:hypothetical protein